MSADPVESETIAKELSSLLAYDSTVLLAYVRALASDGELRASQMGSLVGLDQSNSQKLIETMLRDGLIIASKLGYVPLHPRLALGNLYRQALAKDEKVRAGRVRIDALTGMLVKRREEVQGW